MFVLPPEVLDIIFVFTGRADLAYRFGRLTIMRHFQPETYEMVIGKDYFEYTFASVFGAGNDAEPPAVNLVDWAASSGRLGYLRYLTEKTKEIGTSYAMDSAAYYGHLDVVKFMHKNRSEGCTGDAMNDAARNGHLEVVKYLHSNRDEGCTAFAMTFAAKNGHLDVVKFLHENRNEGCTEDALRYAAKNGHVDIVKFLYERRSEGDISFALLAATDLEVVNYLRSKALKPRLLVTESNCIIS